VTLQRSQTGPHGHLELCGGKAVEGDSSGTAETINLLTGAAHSCILNTRMPALTIRSACGVRGSKRARKSLGGNAYDEWLLV
jgi:hypothetical protein